jgi:hypothetical protein
VRVQHPEWLGDDCQDIAYTADCQQIVYSAGSQVRCEAA